VLAAASVAASAAGSGSGSAYALSTSLAATPLLGLQATLTLGPSPSGVSGTAPADFNQSGAVVSLAGNVLLGSAAVSANTLSASTRSALASEAVNSAAAVQTLNIALTLLGLQAQAVTTTAQATCRNGLVALAGTMGIAGAQTSGLLAGISIAANPAANTVLLNTSAVKVTINEQIVTATGITVNAIHIKLTTALVSGLGLLTGDIVVSQSSASIASCAGASTLDGSFAGWVAPPTFSTFDFASGGATLYRPYYNRADWGGDLQAYPVAANGVVNEATPRWSGGAAARLNAQHYSSGRRIVTVRASDGARIPFRWGTPGLGNTSTTLTAQGALLGSLTTGSTVLDYLRGDRSNETPSGSKLRARNTVLGDIVHSRPFYVADNTNPRIYVGANDGMLHAFDANTGDEVFAYVPSMLFANLSALSVDADPFPHRYYVDGSPNVRKVTIAGTRRTILVGALGAGGKGAYALDVTDPTAADEQSAANKILWEITPSSIAANGTLSSVATYANLGYTQAAPLIVRVNSNGGEWAAVIANGYDSAAGNASLYVISLSTGALIREIVTPAPGTAAAPSGLSKPAAIDVDGNGTVDRIYAGDVDGNVWRFDLTATSASSWSVSKLYTTSPAQAITSAPTIALHPLGGYMVLFGTGRLLTAADTADASTVHAVYGLRDNGTALTAGNAGLVAQTLTAKTAGICASTYAQCLRISSSNPVNYGRNEGWRLALPAGERVVGEGGLVDSVGRFTFTSTNPTIRHAVTSNGSLQPRGENWLLTLAYDTGGAAATPGFDLNADGVLDVNDLLGASGSESRVPVGRMVRYGAASQPILAQLSTFSKPYFNTNADVDVPATSSGDLGGGHFDVDLYYAACSLGSSTSGSTTTWSYSCPTNVHKHQYDDAYRTTGINFLNPSLSTLGLDNAVAAASTRTFKILMSNQKLSPAVGIKVGTSADPDAYTPVTGFVTSSAIGVAALPTYTRATLARFELNVPLNAFTVRDWAGTGDSRLGVVPGDASCVHANNNTSNSGPDPWMNGALTLQLVDAATTTDSDVEQNVAGDPSMGYRLKKTAQAKQLAQYTLFFHAATGLCYGDPGYSATPPLDATTGTSGSSVGAGDPTTGYNTPANTRGSSTQVVVDTDFLGGTTVTTTVRSSRPSAAVIAYGCATCASGAVSPPPPAPPAAQNYSRLVTGRMSWREMLRN